MIALIVLLVVVAVMAVLGSLAADFGVDSRDFAARARDHRADGY